MPKKQAIKPSDPAARPCRSRLTASNLQCASSLAKVDKELLIQSYVQSQHSYRSAFELEGRQARAAWDKRREGEIETSQRESPSKALPDVGFATPVLKPRVPAKVMEHNNSSNTQNEHEGRDNLVQHDLKRNAGKTFRQPNRARGQGEKKATLLGGIRHGNLDQLVTAQRKRKRQSEKEGKSHDSDSGRAGVLAQRRERRRTKKAIVGSKDNPNADDEENESASKRPAGKKTKAKKGSGDISAGLALMHGFSATNVGSSRLTMKPTFGVFHNGKASVKAKVSPRSSARSKHLENLWTEANFLNARKAKAKNDKTIGTDSSRCSCHEEESLPSGKDSPIPKNRKTLSEVKTPCRSQKQVKKFVIRNYERKVESTPERDLSSPENDVAQHVQQLSTTGSENRPTRVESVAWDIESIGDEARVQKSHSDIKSASIPNDPSVTSCQVLLNTRVTTWNLPGSDLLPTQSAPGDEDVLPLPSNRSELVQVEPSLKSSQTSLCPSQSASQAELRCPGPSTLGQSKYFKNITQCQSAPDFSEGRTAKSIPETTCHFPYDEVHHVGFSRSNYDDRAAASASVLEALPVSIHSDDSLASFRQFDHDHLEPNGMQPIYTYSDWQPHSEALQSICGQHPGNFTLSRPLHNEMVFAPYADPEYVNSEMPLHDLDIELCETSEAEAHNYDEMLSNIPSYQVSSGPRIEDSHEEDPWLSNVVNPHDCDDTLAACPAFYVAAEEPYELTVNGEGSVAEMDYCNVMYDAAEISSAFALSVEEESAPSRVPTPTLEANMFSCGRALLRGFPAMDSSHSMDMTAMSDVMVGHLRLPTVLQVEEDVAKHLHDHWLPQRL